jgi:hypothetical protein
VCSDGNPRYRARARAPAAPCSRMSSAAVVVSSTRCKEVVPASLETWLARKLTPTSFGAIVETSASASIVTGCDGTRLTLSAVGCAHNWIGKQKKKTRLLRQIKRKTPAPFEAQEFYNFGDETWGRNLRPCIEMANSRTSPSKANGKKAVGRSPGFSVIVIASDLPSQAIGSVDLKWRYSCGAASELNGIPFSRHLEAAHPLQNVNELGANILLGWQGSNEPNHFGPDYTSLPFARQFSGILVGLSFVLPRHVGFAVRNQP